MRERIDISKCNQYNCTSDSSVIVYWGPEYRDVAFCLDHHNENERDTYRKKLYSDIRLTKPLATEADFWKETWS